MNIKFTSIITKQQDEANKIEFISPVEISEYQEYKVYEFLEPSQNTANRIEVKEGAVNIFAGNSTINLEIDNLVRNEYATPHGTIYFSSFLNSLKISETEVVMNYDLKNGQMEIGNFDITLKIS